MSKNFSIAIIDDEKHVLRFMEKMLGAEYDVHCFTEFDAADRFIDSENVNLVLLDYKLKETDGLEVLKEIKRKRPETEVIMVTAYGDVETAVRATKAGAFHFLTKPFEAEVLKPRKKYA